MTPLIPFPCLAAITLVVLAILILITINSWFND